MNTTENLIEMSTRVNMQHNILCSKLMSLFKLRAERNAIYSQRNKNCLQNVISTGGAAVTLHFIKNNSICNSFSRSIFLNLKVSAIILDSRKIRIVNAILFCLRLSKLEECNKKKCRKKLNQVLSQILD